MAKNKQADLKKLASEYIVVLIVVAIIIIGLIIFFTRNTLKNNTNQIQTSPNNTQVLPVETKDSIKFENKTLKLKDGWTIDTAVRSSKDLNLICQNGNDDACTVYFITKSNLKFYISTPNTIKANDPKAITTQVKKLSVGTVLKEFSYDKYTVAKGDALDSGIVMYSQIYGCIENKICVSSGLLPEGVDENKKMVETFEGFIKTIVLQ